MVVIAAEEDLTISTFVEKYGVETMVELSTFLERSMYIIFVSMFPANH